ncbi:MAG: cysteine synthase A [Bacteroidaceae bacterium]|nr:cysteine synthase A [Bacteroidaceae bacterium]
MKIAQDMTALVGHTPLVELTRYAKKQGLKARLVAKVEGMNPSGSVKARAALAMVEEAERCGKLLSGGTIIEPTSGNTGIGLAMVAAVKGYRLILTMPDTMSMERRKLLVAYGAEVVLTEGRQGMMGCIAKAEELHQVIPGSIIPMQFANRANSRVHESTTGVEIWDDTDGLVAVFVAGVGTGGTVSGVGHALKRRNPEIHIVAVEPAASPVLQGGRAAPHGIQGIGANFVPDNYDARVVDEVVAVTDDEAIAAAREVAITEGLLVGISSGAALCAACQLAMRSEYKDKIVVVLLPDGGERYLSTKLFEY